MDRARLAYYVSHERWPKQFPQADGVVAEVMFGLYGYPEGGTGEAAFRWLNLNEKQPSVRLEAFWDAWPMLDGLPMSFWEGLANMGKYPSVEQVIVLLQDHDFEDAGQWEAR